MGDRMLEWACVRVVIARVARGAAVGRWHVYDVERSDEHTAETRCGLRFNVGGIDTATRYSTADMCGACAAAVGAHKAAPASRPNRSGRA